MENEIEEQNKQAATSYVTAEEFEDFKANVLGVLHKISEDLTKIHIKMALNKYMPAGDNLSPTEKE